ncbi:NAD(P)-dependent alcohol dehydrogenase [Myxococcaceae bacterium GXIMD 01537]
MKAAVYRQYGPPDVVRIEELARPEPKANEVLIKIRASTVSAGDWRVRSLKLPEGFGVFGRPVFGLFGPRKTILGTELAGEVEAVGSAVRKFKVGDAVFAFPGIGLGCHAEYRTMPEDGRLLHMPAGVGFEEAAAISFGGSTALHFLRDLGKVAPGEDVLIIGASGAVGSAAVQLAKHFGARVTGVTSTPNLELVRELGADRVVDYTRTPVLEGPEKYDVIFDTVGTTSFSTSESALKDGGRLLLAAATLRQLLAASWPSSKAGSKKAIAGTTPERVEYLRELKALVEAGRYKPLIGRTYPLARIAEAHAYAESGRKRGSVVISMDPTAAG